MRNDISLDSSIRKHVCRKCWMKMSISRRIQIAGLFRDKLDGGLGVKELVEKISRALDKANGDADEEQAFRVPWRN